MRKKIKSQRFLSNFQENRSKNSLSVVELWILSSKKRKNSKNRAINLCFYVFYMEKFQI